MKKAVIIMLVFFLIGSIFTGCTGKNTEPSEASAVQSNESSEVADSTSEGQREETVQLTVALLNFGGDMPNKELVAEAMNEITRESLNIEIEMIFFDPFAYGQQLNLAFTAGDTIDLFNVFGVGFSTCATNGYLIDMEEDDLIQTYGQGIIETTGEILNGGRFNGILYGAPNQRDMAKGTDGIFIAAQYLDGIGYEYANDSEIIYTDLAEINNIFAQLHKEYPDINVFGPQADTSYASPNLSIDQIGGDSFGVLLDYGQELEVKDLFSSDVYYEYCSRFYNWNQLGYISGDAATNDLALTAQVAGGTLMAYSTTTKPGIKMQESTAAGQDMVVFQIGEDFMRSDAASGSCWVIGSETRDKVAAMQYLNELFTSPELSTLICWGIEGQEYVYTEDGHITYPEGVTADTPAYRPVAWLMPNQAIAPVWEGTPLDIHIQMKEFNESAIISKAFGFEFDRSSKSTIYSALQNVFQEYSKQLEFGFLDPDEYIPEMVERLESSGLDEYMAEKQRQLDEWLVANSK